METPGPETVIPTRDTVHCIGFEGRLPSGASRPLLCRDRGDHLWVVKVHGNPLGTKSIYNEFVAGSLARELGLPWPEVAIVELSPDVRVQVKQEGIELLSKWAVGLRFIRGIEPVDWPPGGHRTGDTDFSERNARHICAVFPDPTAHTAFYGKAVFDNWVLLRSDTKYDTLHVDPHRRPVFLDGSFALEGEDWDASGLEWQLLKIGIHFPYLEGILTDASQFEPWLARVAQIDRGVVASVVEKTPTEWSAPQEYAEATIELFGASRSVFVPLFREGLYWDMLGPSGEDDPEPPLP